MILRGDIIMKKLRLKKLTKFLVVLFAVAVLIGSFTHYSSKALAAYCEGTPMDCIQPCEVQGWEIKQSTVAQDECTHATTWTRIAVTGYCGEYWEYTGMKRHILGWYYPVCELFLCSSDYSRTSGNCTWIN
jgi:hypothetical protein